MNPVEKKRLLKQFSGAYEAFVRRFSDAQEMLAHDYVGVDKKGRPYVTDNAVMTVWSPTHKEWFDNDDERLSESITLQMKKKIMKRTRRQTVSEALRSTMRGLLREEGEMPPSPSEKEEGSDSIDSQVDRYLAQYESEAKVSKNEGLDFRLMTRRFLIEAGDEGEDEGGGDEKPEEPAVPEEPTKLTLDDLDVESFANSLVRLIENYDSLLEVKSTLARRAMNFIGKSYSPEVVDALKEKLREDHGLVPGESKEDVDNEEFVAPLADRSGGESGGGPA